jgi:hypothetical protein
LCCFVCHCAASFALYKRKEGRKEGRKKGRKKGRKEEGRKEERKKEEGREKDKMKKLVTSFLINIKNWGKSPLLFIDMWFCFV